MTAFEFNKLYIMQSLSEADLMRGLDTPNRNLIKVVDDAIKQNGNLNFMQYELLTIDSGESQFKDIMEYIRNECVNNKIYPIIHFLGHGGKGQGIFVWNKNTGMHDCVSWESLFTCLGKINKDCHNNLFYTTTACYGFDCFRKLFAVQLDNIPIVGIVAIDPDKEFYVADANIVFCEFYKRLLETLSIDTAINAVVALESRLIGKAPYIEFTDNWFVRIYKSIVDQLYSKEHISKLIETYKFSKRVKNKTLSDLRAQIEKKKQADYIRIRNRKFMFTDPLVDRTRFNLPNRI